MTLDAAAAARLRAALARADEEGATPWHPAPVRPHAPLRRFVALGDPQAPAAVFFEVLARNDLLADDGFLAPDVSLLSIGDHFDPPGGEPRSAGRDGLRILHWLCAHAPTQCHVLLGNHDLARVSELALETAESFAHARQLASAIAAHRAAGEHAAAAGLAEGFATHHPSIPTPRLAERDYSSYDEMQRRTVMALLLGRRLLLAQAGFLPGGRELLLTHAAVTTRELRLLGIEAKRQPRAIAARLNRFLEEAVARVAPRWHAGVPAPLALDPLHVTGRPGEEPGGLLAHRPVNPDISLRPAANLAWEFDPEWPRRYKPRELPAGLAQVCGHTPHRTSLCELVGWLGPHAAASGAGSLRTLRVRDDSVVYETGLLPLDERCAGLYLIDGDMVHTKPGDYRVLDLCGWEDPARQDPPGPSDAPSPV
jgi:hypothetical protein